jgi:alkyldihydroxyacetonephosphate synthase
VTSARPERLAGPSREVPAALLDALRAACTTHVDDALLDAHSRDWWPLALAWAHRGMTARRPAAVAEPASTEEVRAVARLCHAHRVPLTVAGGRSGVLGAAIPARGGVVLSTRALRGVVGVDAESGLVEVLAGTMGPELEDAVAPHGLVVGHHPQSFSLSTVGGWIGARGAGQYSTRVGTIAALVAGLEVVLADGTLLRLGPEPASAAGPDLASLFVGAEGTLGIVTRAWLRARPLPAARAGAAWRLPSLAAGIGAMRAALRAGATPAVLRLYDERETRRAHGGDGTWCALLVHDEAAPELVDATLAVVARCARAEGAESADPRLVDAWFAHRDDVSGLHALTARGWVIDTLEVAAPWARLAAVADGVRTAIAAVPGARSATVHVSHSYVDGACAYFTFVGDPGDGDRGHGDPGIGDLGALEALHGAMWEAGQGAALRAGATLSHHHGIGLHRARWAPEALGASLGTLAAIKRTLDPHGILNPGKWIPGDDA